MYMNLCRTRLHSLLITLHTRLLFLECLGAIPEGEDVNGLCTYLYIFTYIG